MSKVYHLRSQEKKKQNKPKESQRWVLIKIKAYTDLLQNKRRDEMEEKVGLKRLMGRYFPADSD